MKKPNKMIMEVSQRDLVGLHLPNVLKPYRVYVTGAIRGYADYNEKYITIPKVAIEKYPWEYFLYYVAHEMSHILVREKKLTNRTPHNESFYQCFRQLCPVELQHYELNYKPRGAKLSQGVRKGDHDQISV